MEGALQGIASRLEEVRKDQGLSQEAFAKRLGISRSAYQHYSRGKHEIPTTILVKLLTHFKVDPYWMIEGDERGMAPEQEDILLKNTIKVALATRSAFEQVNLKPDDEKITNAAFFAIKFLFDRRSPVEDEANVIGKYVATIEGAETK